MLLECFYHDKLAHASYIVGCQDHGVAIVIDPGRHIEQYIEFATRQGLDIIAVTETHIHADFVSGTKELALCCNATVYASDEGDCEWKYQYLAQVPYQLIKDGSEFNIGTIQFQVIHTPGHTPESISFLVIDTKQHNYTNEKPIGIFTGDFLFVGDVGRPDLLETAVGIPHHARSSAEQLFHSIQKIKTMPAYLQIWPSHRAGSSCGKSLGAIPSSTIGYEKHFNWAFQTEEQDSFVMNVLSGQPEPPPYFAQMKQINQSGPPIRNQTLVKKIESFPVFQQIARTGKQIIDTREPTFFASGHVEGSLNIPYNQSFTTWCGWLIDYNQDLIIVIDPLSTDINKVRRDLEAIGLDRTIVYVSSNTLKEMGPLETYEERTVQEMFHHIRSGTYPVIDVRNKAEWEEGHLPHAKHMMLGHLTEHLHDIPKNCPIVVQCRSGIRSAIAASILRKYGVKEVINLQGGYLAWLEAKFPICK
ncbi:MBL fold metallo-hydrolase [Bacillus toyonensis]|uniref:Zn-dependent hydrolase n=1 Tax=Bacillus toyonensis TaxID=155322 RepID=A0A2A8H8M6_9BACI|nr:MBL fold metallo-hydrolase [Bacillus toyonensis]PEP96512.1 Zn-dependent hydrolase [Bacillus toyonensis]